MYSLLHRYKGITVAIIAVASAGFFLWLFFAGEIKDLTSPSKRCVVEVGSGCVTLKDYRRELLRFSELLKNPQMEDLVREQVLSNLIAQELLYQKAKDLSFIASDEEVVEVIKSDPSFQEGGLFTSSKYREVLSKIGLTPEEYEDYIRRALSIQKLINFISNGVYLSEKELEINLLADRTLLSGSLYIVSPADISQSYQTSEQEMLEYYQKNKELFKRPEEKVIWVWREKDKEKVQSIYKELQSGKEPQGYKEYKLPEDLQKMGSLLGREAQRLTPQERQNITKEGDEYVVLYLKQVIPSGYEEFERVKDKVRERLVEEKAQSMAEKKAQEVAKALKEGKKPDARSLSFSDTPALQLSAVVNIKQSDIAQILLSQEKVFGPYPLRQGYGVLLVEKRKREELKPEEKEEVFRDILSLKSQAMLTQYVEYLKRHTKIRINKEMLGGG